MSAPRLELKEVEFLSLGFTINGAINALEKCINGADLSKKDVKSLEEAASFLKDIASGANFITSGKVPAGFNASRSLAAFNYAMGPTEALKGLIKDDDVAKFFGNIARAVANARDGVFKPGDSPHIEEAISFLRPFYKWVVAELNSRQPVLGTSSLRKGMLAFS